MTESAETCQPLCRGYPIRHLSKTVAKNPATEGAEDTEGMPTAC